MSGSSAFSVADVELSFGPALTENPPLTVGWIVCFQQTSSSRNLADWEGVSLALFPLGIPYALLSSFHGTPFF